MARNNSRHFLFAALFVISMLVATVQAPFMFTSDDVSAVESPAVQNPSIKIFDQDSTDYSNLVYLNDELPLQLSAVEWVKDTTTGLWFNVNSTCSNYGKVLRYGVLSGVTVNEIRNDVLDYYNTVFTGTDFVLVQMDYQLSNDCGVKVEIEKDGSLEFEEMSEMTMDISGSYMNTTVQMARVCTVDATNGDIRVADARGLYELTVRCNGTTISGGSVKYGATQNSLGGLVKDQGNKPISGAIVSYSIMDSGSNIIEIGSKITDSTGAYVIIAETGTIVNITSIAATGFTFSSGQSTYSYGTVTSDVSPGPTFNSNENYIKVTVLDQSDAPAPGVEISALWYTCEGTSGDYNVSASDSGRIIVSNTGDDGSAIIVISEVHAGAKFLIKGVDSLSTYTFNTDVIYAGHFTTVDPPLPASTTEDGNTYANTTSFADVVIRAKQSSMVVTTAGGLDALEGGEPIWGVRVNAIWYYQVSDGAGGYYIRQADGTEAGTFEDLVPGTAWLSNQYSSKYDGQVRVVYTAPGWTLSGDEVAYLYIYVSGCSIYAPAAAYTFSHVNLLDGVETIEDLVTDKKACVALEKSTILPSTTATVRSDEPAYKISGTITGTLPGSITVGWVSGSLADEMTLIPAGSTVNFAFTVKDYTSNSIYITDVPGYTFSNPSQVLPTVSGDQVFSSTCSLSTGSIDRDAPAVVSTYQVSNVTAGNIITFTYRISGTEYTVLKRASANTLSFDVNGWAGSIVESMIATGSGLYITDFTGNTASASKLVQRTFVSYYDTEANTPDTSNVVGGQTIKVYCNGEPYTTIVTDQEGMATVTVPDADSLTFKYENLSVTSVAVSSGAYAGCYGINMKDVIPSPQGQEITVTLRYIAVSSLQNESPVTNVDILDSPIQLKLTVGTTNQFIAPDVEGFTFSGWFINGTSVSNTKNINVCNLEVTQDMDNCVLTASYSANSPDPLKENLATPIAIGALGVIIAVIAMIYVIFQIRRY